MQDDKAKFDEAGAMILAVNNNTVAAHQGYCEKSGFTFPILADADLKVAKAYGADSSACTAPSRRRRTRPRWW